MADGGYTPAEIDAFPLAAVNAIYASWSRQPPVRQMVAAYLGIKPKKKAGEFTPTHTASAIRAAFPDGQFKV